MSKKLAQRATLSEMFDLSEDYFKNRMCYRGQKSDPFKKPFVEGIFFFIPPTQSVTKKAVLWDVAMVESYLRNEYIPTVEVDDELAELLSRTKLKKSKKV